MQFLKKNDVTESSINSIHIILTFEATQVKMRRYTIHCTQTRLDNVTEECSKIEKNELQLAACLHRITKMAEKKKKNA